jgi:hypothetical protein
MSVNVLVVAARDQKSIELVDSQSLKNFICSSVLGDTRITIWLWKDKINKFYCSLILK